MSEPGYTVSLKTDLELDYEDGFANGYSRGWTECWEYMRDLMSQKPDESVSAQEAKPGEDQK